MDNEASHTPDVMMTTTVPTSARPQRKPRWRDYTAFVFSSGGARGALQVGGARALMEHGITPDVIVGTSIGSWNGAMLARTPTLEGVEALTKVWSGLSTSRVLLGWESHLPTAVPAYTGAMFVTAIRRVTQGYPSLYSDAGLRQVFSEHLAGIRFEDMAIPFRAIAANLSTGGLTVFGRGPIELALLASAAIPGIFPPVSVAGEILVDGGALESASIDTAIQLGARSIFVLDAGYDVTTELEAQLRTLLDRTTRNGHQPNAHALAVILERTLAMMGRYQLEQAIQRIPPGIELHVLRPAATMDETTLDFDHTARWIDLAYHQAIRYLEEHLPHRQSTSPTEEADRSEATTSRAG